MINSIYLSEGEDAPPPAAGEPPETSPSQIAAVPASGGGGDEAEGAAAAASEERKPSMKEPSPKASGTSTGKKDSEKKGSLKRGSLFGDKGGALQDNTLKDTLQEFFSNAPKEQDEKSTALKPLRRPKVSLLFLFFFLQIFYPLLDHSIPFVSFLSRSSSCTVDI